MGIRVRGIEAKPRHEALDNARFEATTGDILCLPSLYQANEGVSHHLHLMIKPAYGIFRPLKKCQLRKLIAGVSAYEDNRIALKPGKRRQRSQRQTVQHIRYPADSPEFLQPVVDGAAVDTSNTRLPNICAGEYNSIASVPDDVFDQRILPISWQMGNDFCTQH